MPAHVADRLLLHTQGVLLYRPCSFLNRAAGSLLQACQPWPSRRLHQSLWVLKPFPMDEVDDQQLARFLEATHCSVEQAQFFLEASGGVYDRALNMYYGVWGQMANQQGSGAAAAAACHSRCLPCALRFPGLAA